MANNTFSIFVDCVEVDEEDWLYINGFSSCCPTMTDHVFAIGNICIKKVGLGEDINPRLVFFQTNEGSSELMKPVNLNYCPFCSARIIAADAQTMREITSRTEVKNKLSKRFPEYAKRITIDDLLKTREGVS